MRAQIRVAVVTEERELEPADVPGGLMEMPGDRCHDGRSSMCVDINAAMHASVRLDDPPIVDE